MSFVLVLYVLGYIFTTSAFSLVGSKALNARTSTHARNDGTQPLGSSLERDSASYFPRTRPKIALIGGGNIGGTLALLCIQRQLGDIVLFDILDGFAKGKALDLEQSSTIDNIDVRITGTQDYQDIEGADIVIVTAGSPR